MANLEECVESAAPGDPDMAAFVKWAVKKYKQHAYRHTSATSGEWAAWQAATQLARERRRVALPTELCEPRVQELLGNGLAYVIREYPSRAAECRQLLALLSTLQLKSEASNVDAPICPWCDRQGWDNCGSHYDTYTCEARL